MDAQLAPETPGLSQTLAGLTGWVRRVGPARVTLVLTALVSIGSLLLTWAALRLSGYQHMGNAWWISMVVPIPLTVVFGGLSTYLLSALERARSQVHDLAMLDPLTGLCNRRRFLTAAKRELDLATRHGQPVAVLMLDIDHFKLINDVHGHAVGDRMLVEVGQRCASALRTTDLLARWGGEEFMALLPNTSVEQARILAERVRETIAVSASVQLHDRSVRATVSVGAAGSQAGHRLALDELLRVADVQLYEAKRAGRNRVSISGWVAAALVRAMPASTRGTEG